MRAACAREHTDEGEEGEGQPIHRTIVTLAPPLYHCFSASGVAGVRGGSLALF